MGARSRAVRIRGIALGALAFLVAAPPAAAELPGTPLHELIAPDAREDLAMRVTVDGDIPAAMQTPSGVVSAPDPRALPTSTDRSYGPKGDADVYKPDRDTQRPDVSAYDDPFTPSTAPFKRLEAFDAIRDDEQLFVRDTRTVPVSPGPAAGSDEEAFYADMVVDVAPTGRVRIPSVGPGARIVRARLGVGLAELPMRVVRDGADNWFLQTPDVRSPVRARLVMELAIRRAAFGGQLGDPAWGDLSVVPPLPDTIARDAAQVRAAIGVSRAMRPRDAIARLVQYFRGFVDSSDAPTGHGSVYLDLALSKKGVCRHRAFAFLVTAQSLGIPSRMVLNEAHAWVEVHDGALWKRIDLGGAGRMQTPTDDAHADRAVHRPPPDNFPWPQNAERGDDMVADARARAETTGGGPGASTAANGASNAATDGGAHDAGAAASASATTSAPDKPEEPGATVVTLRVDDADPHRGVPLHVHGVVNSEGEPCAHVAVEIVLRDARTRRMTALGTLATDGEGHFAGGIVVPASTALGDYDVLARTTGDARCGGASSN